MEDSVQETNINTSKVYINMDRDVMDCMDFITSHGTTYGLSRPTRKALIESLILREYKKIRTEQREDEKWNLELEDRGITFEDK